MTEGPVLALYRMPTEPSPRRVFSLFAAFALLVSCASGQDVPRPATPSATTLASKTSQIAAGYRYYVFLEGKIAAKDQQIAALTAQLGSSASLDQVLARITALERLFQICRVEMIAPYSKLTLQWDDNSDSELGYEIERSIDGAAFSPVGTVSKDVTLFVDSNLKPGTYWYRVRGYDAAGKSAYSNITSAKAGPP